LLKPSLLSLWLGLNSPRGRRSSLFSAGFSRWIGPSRLTINEGLSGTNSARFSGAGFSSGLISLTSVLTSAGFCSSTFTSGICSTFFSSLSPSAFLTSTSFFSGAGFSSIGAGAFSAVSFSFLAAESAFNFSSNLDFAPITSPSNLRVSFKKASNLPSLKS